MKKQVFTNAERKQMESFVDYATARCWDHATNGAWSVEEEAGAAAYWWLLHSYAVAEVKVNKASLLRILMTDGVFGTRSKGSVEAKLMNLSSAAQKWNRDNPDQQIQTFGRYTKRGCGTDMGPAVLPGYTVAHNRSRLDDEMLHDLIVQQTPAGLKAEAYEVTA